MPVLNGFDCVCPFGGNNDLVVFYFVKLRQDLGGDSANVFPFFHLSPSAVRLEGFVCH